MDSLDEPFDFPLPDWAISASDGSYGIGAQLCTKDGRRIGNAVIFNRLPALSGGYWEIVTDIGTVLKLETEELDEYFHKPRYVMHLDTHIGYKHRGR